MANKKARVAGSMDIYRDMIDSVNSIIIRWDMDLNFTFLNKYALDFFCLTLEEAIGRSIIGTIVPETSTAGQDLVAMCRDIVRHPGQYVNNLNENMRGNGERVWISWTNKPILDDEGNVVDILSVGNDFTARKKAEEALVISDQRYRSLFENMLNGYAYCRMIYDENGSPEDFVYLDVNSAFARLTGLDNVTGKRATVAIPGIREQHPELFEIYGRVAMTGKPESFEIEFKPIGAWLSVAVYSTERGYFTAVFDNITGRKQSEKALRTSETRFRALIQNSSDIIRIVGRDRRIIYDSPSSERILGYPPGVTIGKSPFEFIHPDDREKARMDMDEVFENKNPGKPTGVRIRKADGSYVDVESIGVNLIGTPGVDGIVITSRPITERKRAEADLKKAKEQAELYLDLMGHDINNLHQIAMGYLEFAREMAGPESGQKEFLEKPIEVLRRGARLIDNVRKLQKLREGAYVNRPVDVRKVLANALGEYRDMPGKTITADYHGNRDCRIVANDLLSDVFSNLVDNAIKHARNKPHISVSLEKVRENGCSHYRVAVEDNGPGIPDSMKGKIFNRLLEGDSHSRGMGLGLYMVKSLVEDYNGIVWVEDRIAGDHAKGARFVVMLPAAD